MVDSEHDPAAEDALADASSDTAKTPDADEPMSEAVQPTHEGPEDESALDDSTLDTEKTPRAEEG